MLLQGDICKERMEFVAKVMLNETSCKPVRVVDEDDGICTKIDLIYADLTNTPTHFLDRVIDMTEDEVMLGEYVQYKYMEEMNNGK